MLGLKGIHSFVTDPKASRYEPKKYLEHVLITQMLSAWWWKKINGPIVLYTTPEDAAFLAEMKMLSFYDEVNTEVLSRDEGISWSEFGPAVKMRAAADQKTFPFATIDNDLVFRAVLGSNDLNSDLTVLHREVFLNRSYPPVEHLGKREGYQFPAFLSEKVDPINVGFLIWTIPQLFRDYWALAKDYMFKNVADSKSFDWTADTPTLPKFWKSLFVEQRLLSALCEKDNYFVNTMFPLRYSDDIEIWVDSDGKRKDFDQVQKDTNLDFYHLWGEKSSYYKLDPPFCGGNQIRTLYLLIKETDNLGDEKLKEALDEIILFTIKKTHALNLGDFYELRTASKYLLK